MNFWLLLLATMLASEALVSTIAPLVPHSSVGLWFANAFLGLSLVLCGYFSPRNRYPRPIIFYPFHFISYHTYSFIGAPAAAAAAPSPPRPSRPSCRGRFPRPDATAGVTRVTFSGFSPPPRPAQAR